MEVNFLIQNLTRYLSDFLKLQFVLSGFAQHLASHFGKSLSNHSFRYDFSNDLPNCFASYCANSGSLVNYAGQAPGVFQNAGVDFKMVVSKSMD